MERLYCKDCNRKFKYEKNYQRHRDSHKRKLECYVCNRSFTRKDNLDRHVRGYFVGYKNIPSTYSCSHCEKKFENYSSLFEHIRINHGHFRDQQNQSQQQGYGNLHIPQHREGVSTVGENDNQQQNRKSEIVERETNQLQQRVHSFETKEKTSLNGLAMKFSIYPSKQNKYDLLLFFTETQQLILNHLKQRCATFRGIKWYMSVHVQMIRFSNKEVVDIAEPHFHSGTFTLLHSENNIQHDINAAFQKQFKSFDEYIARGSGWTLKKVLSLTVATAKYQPIRGSSYFPVPKSLRKKVVNVQNKDDEKCFVWAILAHLHYNSIHPERISNYAAFERDLNMGGISYPVSISQIPQFERQNIDIAVNIFGFENEHVFPLYLSKQKHRLYEIDLLYLKKGNKSHYCLIRSLTGLLRLTRTSHRMSFVFRRCLQMFSTVNALQKHSKFCSTHNSQYTEMPELGKNDSLYFTEISKQLKCEFVIYADFECFAKKIDTVLPSPTKSNTTPYIRYEVNSYCYQVVSTHKKYTSKPVLYRGENAVERFLENILEEEEIIRKILNSIVPMNMTVEEKIAFETSTKCYICKKQLLFSKVRDHCHVCGRYRGACCQKCNLNLKYPKYVPVILHNLKNFDSFIIQEALGKFKEHRIKCIPRNMEKFVSFSLGNLRFIDSFQFINCSLEEMVRNLYEKNKDDPLKPFKNLRNVFPKREEAELLTRKGIYCYEYVQDFAQFEETALPEKHSFYSSLTKQNISDSDYDFAKTVWEKLSIKNLGHYHDTYLLCDTLLLADCFETFREACLDNYGLDSAHFFTNPGLAWCAALKMSGCRLELLTDPDMYMFFENSIRGGISTISKRFSVANNIHLPDSYDVSKESQYIIYYDCSNLYGKAMCAPLPIGEFRWLSSKEIQRLDILNIGEHSELGYLFQVDLEYNESLHDLHADYPLCSEQQTIDDECLSPYSKNAWKKMQVHFAGLRKRIPTGKLIATLHDKKEYILHYRYLQTCLRLGLKLKKIHRVLQFRQTPFLHTYIDFNTRQGKKAQNKFEESFYKMMNNAVFGKTMENVRGRVDIKLVHTESQFLKYVNRVSFKRFEIFNEDLTGVENAKTSILLNKPIYIGQAILDISKVIMCSFHYGHIKSLYGSNATLLFTDTDSLCYEIKTRDIYKDMLKYRELFDFSNYSKTHYLHSTENSRKPGTFKDETGGSPIKEFVGLRSKLYSFCYGDSEKKTAKGICRGTIKRDLRHTHYKTCLLQGETKYCRMNMIKPIQHKLNVATITKLALSPFDDKRYILEDGVNTLPFGHKRIKSTLSK